jgi:hypothetical protein
LILIRFLRFAGLFFKKQDKSAIFNNYFEKKVQKFFFLDFLLITLCRVNKLNKSLPLSKNGIANMFRLLFVHVGGVCSVVRA